ncbi:MAG: response regulator transcription factor [Tyzzerella sp.]|nr:response regulator transcription factor [Tyzzerella sp.]
MSSKYKILIVEDDTNISNFVKTILSTNGYQALAAKNGKNGEMMFHSHCPDLLILDLGLPDTDGIDFIKMVRETSDMPIIVLSARTGERDKVEALDFGANDYVTKPFGTDELLARVRVALRNNRQGNGDKAGMNQFTMKDLFIDYDERKVTLEETEVKLTQTEYNIVQLLSIYAGRVLTYSEIIKKIWGYSDSGSIKKLQVNMANIRKKLGEKPGENQYIANELGVGYRMIAPEER